MKGARLLDAAQGRRHIDRLKREAIPVQACRPLGLPTPAGLLVLPLAHLDATDRPDIADLARVHLGDGQGEGDVETTWGFTLVPGATNLVVLHVRFLRPVRCSLSLAWDLDRDRAFLELVAASGLVVLTPVDPDAAPAEALAAGVVVPTRTDELAGVLVLAALIGGAGVGGGKRRR